MSPEDFRSWGRLAAAYQQIGGRSAEANSEYNRAMSLANEIISINPNESDAQKNIALCYAHTKKADLAEGRFRCYFRFELQRNLFIRRVNGSG